VNSIETKSSVETGVHPLAWRQYSWASETRRPMRCVPVGRVRVPSRASRESETDGSQHDRQCSDARSGTLRLDREASGRLPRSMGRRDAGTPLGLSG